MLGAKPIKKMTNKIKVDVQCFTFIGVCFSEPFIDAFVASVIHVICVYYA